MHPGNGLQFYRTAVLVEERNKGNKWELLCACVYFQFNERLDWSRSQWVTQEPENSWQEVQIGLKVRESRMLWEPLAIIKTTRQQGMVPKREWSRREVPLDFTDRIRTPPNRNHNWELVSRRRDCQVVAGTRWGTATSGGGPQSPEGGEIPWLLPAPVLQFLPVPHTGLTT